MVVLVQQLPGFISILSSMHNTWPAVVSLKLPHLYRRDVAQPGRALAWGARGRQFKSARPDHLLLEILRCTQDFACGLPSPRASRPQTGSSSNLPVPTKFQRTGPAAIFSDSSAF